MKILRKLANDADELALPRLELRREFLDEIEDVLLRFRREGSARALVRIGNLLG
jgi:hypothetical protein